MIMEEVYIRGKSSQEEYHWVPISYESCVCRLDGLIRTRSRLEYVMRKEIVTV